MRNFAKTYGAGVRKKRVTKINARRVQDSDIAIGERIRARRNQIEMSQETLAVPLAFLSSRFRSTRRA